MGSPNSLHFMGFATQKGTSYEVPLCFVKYETFSGNVEIETEEDKGHTGSRSLLLGEDRVKATSAPEFEDKLRYEEGLEDFYHHVLGNYEVQSFGTKTKRYIFTPNPDGVLPLVSIFHGYNVSGLTGRGFANAIANELTLTMNAENAPKISVKYLADFPKYDVDMPTLSFLADPPQSVKAGQLKAYMGDVGTLNEQNDLITCLKEASITINNNAENTVCAGLPLGQSNKDVGELTVEGNVKLDYNTANKTLEQLWATGANDGEIITYDSLFKAFRFKYVGNLIETVTGTPNTDYFYTNQIDLPKVDIKSVKPTEGGDGNKEIDIEFKAVTPSSGDIIEIMVQSQLSGLHITP